MGLCLYIEKMPRESQYMGFETSVEVGYFRSGGWRFMGFMQDNLPRGEKFYWENLEDKCDFVDNDALMPLATVKEWLKAAKRGREIIGSRDTPCVKVSESLRGEITTEEHPPDVERYYEDQINLFIRFLELAVEKDSGILVS